MRPWRIGNGEVVACRRVIYRNNLILKPHIKTSPVSKIIKITSLRYKIAVEADVLHKIVAACSDVSLWFCSDFLDTLAFMTILHNKDVIFIILGARGRGGANFAIAFKEEDR